jgi:hypothetical protein
MKQIQHSPAKAHPTAASINDKVTAGPALSAAAIPVNENNRATIAPTPSATRDLEDNVLLTFSSSEASFSKTESGFVFQIDIYLLVYCY